MIKNHNEKIDGMNEMVGAAKLTDQRFASLYPPYASLPLS
jgi:hypothetical protein